MSGAIAWGCCYLLPLALCMFIERKINPPRREQ